jgi:hypothetical protein
MAGLRAATEALKKMFLKPENQNRQQSPASPGECRGGNSARRVEMEALGVADYVDRVTKSHPGNPYLCKWTLTLFRGDHSMLLHMLGRDKVKG